MARSSRTLIGFSLETVEPSGHDSRSILGHHGRSDGDDRGVMRHGIDSQPLQGFHAADTPQLNVHQDQGGLSLVGQRSPSSPVPASMVWYPLTCSVSRINFKLLVDQLEHDGLTPVARGYLLV